MQLKTAPLLTVLRDPTQRKFLLTAFNNTAIYVLAYYVVWGLHQAAKLGVSRYYNLRGRWDPSRIVYSLADDEWWRTAVIATYSSGPALCLLVGVVAYGWYWRRERARRGNFKLLLLWVAFHCCNAVLGTLLADTLTQSGFWYVPDWLIGLGNVVNVPLAVLAGLVQVGLGYFGAVAFLQAHDSKTVMRYPNRQRMVLSTLLVPWVAGSGFSALTKVPYFSVQEFLRLLMMGLLVGPMAMSCLNELFASTVRRPQVTRLAWGLLALAVVVALGWRLALSPPVVFGPRQ